MLAVSRQLDGAVRAVAVSAAAQMIEYKAGVGCDAAVLAGAGLGARHRSAQCCG